MSMARATSTAARALASAVPRPYWLDQPGAPARAPALVGRDSADLLVIGAGFTGLWTALLAKERDPSRDVVLIEADAVGCAASGRNGGFCAASITHGLANGIRRFPREIATLERLGRENLDEFAEAVRVYGIECGFERTGELTAATAEWQLAELREEHEAGALLGRSTQLLDRDEVRAEVDSPLFVGGLRDPDRCAMVDPARLAWGLARTCKRLGVRVFENTRAEGITEQAGRLVVRTPYGSVSAPRVVLGTGAFSPLLRRIRAYVVPVYDYALMTEPLSSAQLDSIGWRSRCGIGDAANQFHYFRLTRDNRILWGGYDAVYYNGGRIRAERDQRPATFLRLAEHFTATFPQLRDVRFTHAWGGVIDTCSRFCPFFGTAYGGRLAYAAGYTGLGVGATRFDAKVLLDLLSGERTELTSLAMVRSKPVPFPPEPLRSGVIQLTRWSIARADRHSGRCDLWLRTLDRLGLGFDS